MSMSTSASRATRPHTPKSRALVVLVLLATAAIQTAFSLSTASTVSTPNTAIWAILPAAIFMVSLLGVLLRKPGPTPRAVGLAALISGSAYPIVFVLTTTLVQAISADTGSKTGRFPLDVVGYLGAIAYLLMFITFVTGDTLVAIVLSLMSGYVIRRITTRPASATRYNNRRKRDQVFKAERPASDTPE